MISPRFLFVLSAAGLLALAACDRGAETEAAREQPASAAAPEPGSPEVAGVETSPDEADQRAASDRTDPRTLPVATHADGKPFWAANRRRTAEEAAERQFERNGKDFGAKTLTQYVDQTHAFVGSPPAGTLRHTRSNGDKLFYDPKGNVFAVATREGAPRTMFKPTDGMAYWEKQKQQQARRRTASGED